MNPYIRLGVGLGAVGGVTGGAYLLNKQLSNDTIGKKLEANGYKLLKGDEKDNWPEILKHYQERIEGNKKDLQFEGFDGKTPPDNTIEALKNKCKSILKEKLGNEENYKKAKKWCTMPKSLIEILKEQGYRALSSDNTKDEEIEEWDKKLVDYDKQDKDNPEKRFNDLNLKGEKTTLEKNKETRNKLKDKCKPLETKKHYEKDFEKELDKSILWCSIKETNK